MGFPSSRLAAVVAVVAMSSPALDAVAAAPLQIDGRLLTAAGGPATDGQYDATLKLFDAAKGGKELAKLSAKLTVTGGVWSVAWPLGADALGHGAAWVELSIGKNPPLPRRPLASTPYALRADVAGKLACSGCVTGAVLAEGAVTGKHLANAAVSPRHLAFPYAGSDTKGGRALSAAKADVAIRADSAKTADVARALQCTGCVGVAALKFDGDVDLQGRNIKGAGSIAATRFIGDGSKLTGIRMPTGACPKGRYVSGIAADGSLKCGPGGGGPVLGGKLTDLFAVTASAPGLPASIPDHTGKVLKLQAKVSDAGPAEDLSVRIALTNSDLSQVRVRLLPPGPGAAPLVVCDPCGEKNARSLDRTLTPATALKSGSLETLLGKPAAGSWTLEVLDRAFCVVQIPENAALCDAARKVDGRVTAFSVRPLVRSSSALRATGPFQLAGYAKPPLVCTPARAGHAYFDTGRRTLMVCTGALWIDTSDGSCLTAKGGPCDDGIACTEERCDKAEGCLHPPVAAKCDDGNACTTDGCDAKTGCMHAAVKDGSMCDDGSKCTTVDACSKGTCAGSQPLGCDDGNACTTDGCDAKKGCTHAALKDGTKCDDGSKCTSAEACHKGACVAGKTVSCDDGEPCTADSCDPKTGQCAHKALGYAACCKAVTGTMESGKYCVKTDSAGRKWGLVPAGTFWMGCNAALDKQCVGDETPQHEVTITKPFWLGLYEVTVAEYKACVDAGKCTAPGTGGDCNWGASGRSEHPVNCVDWSQSKAYCAWVGGRLPTEAEWELSARGRCEENGGMSGCKSKMRVYPWGNASPVCGQQAVFYDSGGYGCGKDRTWSVGTGSASGRGPYGHYDLSGNVWEWTREWYGKYGSGAAQNPTGPASGSLRVLRGGGWDAAVYRHRAANRDVTGPGSGSSNIGFRPARSVP